MTKSEYLEFHREMCDKMIEITKRKNADYAGSGDDPFANFRQVGSIVQVKGVIEIGFVTRMSDKFARIGSFISNGELQVKDESVDDTLLDLANYCILFMGYLESERHTKREGSADRTFGPLPEVQELGKAVHAFNTCEPIEDVRLESNP
jgi:hypothetical protein